MLALENGVGIAHLGSVADTAERAAQDFGGRIAPGCTHDADLGFQIARCPHFNMQDTVLEAGG